MNAHNKHRSVGNFAGIGFGLSLLTAILAAAATDTPSPSPGASAPFAVEDVALFFDQYCSTCHNDVDTEGELDITTLKFTPSDPKNLDTWVKIYDQTKSGEMPPKEKRRPRPAAVKEFLATLGPALEAAKK